jgi:hypothetical protein
MDIFFDTTYNISNGINLYSVKNTWEAWDETQLAAINTNSATISGKYIV